MRKEDFDKACELLTPLGESIISLTRAPHRPSDQPNYVLNLAAPPGGPLPEKIQFKTLAEVERFVAAHLAQRN